MMMSNVGYNSYLRNFLVTGENKLCLYALKRPNQATEERLIYPHLHSDYCLV